MIEIIRNAEKLGGRVVGARKKHNEKLFVRFLLLTSSFCCSSSIICSFINKLYSFKLWNKMHAYALNVLFRTLAFSQVSNGSPSLLAVFMSIIFYRVWLWPICCVNIPMLKSPWGDRALIQLLFHACLLTVKWCIMFKVSEVFSKKIKIQTVWKIGLIAAFRMNLHTATQCSYSWMVAFYLLMLLLFKNMFVLFPHISWFTQCRLWRYS